MKSLFIKRVIAFVSVCLLLAGCAGPANTDVPVENTNDASTAAAVETTTSSASTTIAAEAPISSELIKEAPVLSEQVKSGSLPPLDERLPEVPKIMDEMSAEQFTFDPDPQYGGVLHVGSAAQGTSGDIVNTLVEWIVTSPGFGGEEINGNIIEKYEVNSDSTVFTFYLRKGLKWSDGAPVTSEDIRFAWEDVQLNADITATPPAYMKTSGRADNNPASVEIVDEFTVKITFDGPYYGFLRTLSLMGPTYDFLFKPSHFLTPFHKDYADPEEFDKMLQEAGVEPDNWGIFFNDKDIVRSELFSPGAIGFPTLTPWIPVETSVSNTRFERNPYYFKVDDMGRQLPYIDTIDLTYLSSIEVLNNMLLSGDLEISRESTSVFKLPLYKENEDIGKFNTYVWKYHGRIANVFLNHNYEDANWQSVIHDLRFKEAIDCAIDKKTINDTLYYSQGILPEQFGSSVYDTDRANALLDELGLDQRNAEGVRLYPDGSTVDINFDVTERVVENVDTCELVVLMLKEVGLNANMKVLEQNLHIERRTANQIQAMMERSEAYWFHGDVKWSYWAPMYESWFTSAGETGIEPPDDVKQLYDYVIDIQTASTPDALAAYDNLAAAVKANRYYIPLMDYTNMPLIMSKRLGNSDCHGDVTSMLVNYAMEQLYFKN